MDQSVGHKLTNGDLRIDGHGLAKGLLDLFVLWQQVVDEANRSFEADSLALVSCLFSDCLNSILAFVLDHSQSFASQPVKLRQVPGKQDGPDIGDVEVVITSIHDHLLPAKPFQNAGAVVWQRLFEQFETGRVYSAAFIPEDSFKPDDTSVLIYDGENVESLDVFDVSGNGNDGKWVHVEAPH